jgi:hypothetical protein
LRLRWRQEVEPVRFDEVGVNVIAAAEFVQGAKFYDVALVEPVPGEWAGLSRGTVSCALSGKRPVWRYRGERRLGPRRLVASRRRLINRSAELVAAGVTCVEAIRTR